MKDLNELIKIYTTLTEEDYYELKQAADNLNYISELVQADVFIDCITRDKDVAVVIAHSMPTIKKSIYSHHVIGEYALRKNEPAVLRSLEFGIPSRDLKALTQENIAVRQTVTPIKNSNGATIGVIIIEADISGDINRQKHVRMLAEANEKLAETLISFSANESEREREIARYINDAILIFSKDGFVLYANEPAKELYKKLGYQDNILMLTLNNLLLGDIDLLNFNKESAYCEAEVSTGKLSLTVKYAVSKNQIIMLINDLTDLKEKENELLLKSTVIKEIHHRVKNNIQTVASLLRLQSRRIEDDSIRKMFEQSISRIYSISITHELLAQSGIDMVDIKQIVKIILDSIFFEKEITKEIKGDCIELDSETATSVGLVVNELLSNVAKYAFTLKEKGAIIVLIQKGNLYSSITVSDDGQGFDVLEAESGSLGFSIVRNIVENKLLGKLDIKSGNFGTTVTFDFKNLI